MYSKSHYKPHYDTFKPHYKSHYDKPHYRTFIKSHYDKPHFNTFIKPYFDINKARQTRQRQEGQ